jgi:sulfate adenylyltransferase subunit 2
VRSSPRPKPGDAVLGREGLDGHGASGPSGILSKQTSIPTASRRFHLEFQSLIALRDDFAREHGFPLIAYADEEARTIGINPFDYGDRDTAIMRTEPLKAALDQCGYDIIFGGARRDEEKSRAKERIVSIRSAAHAWEPRQQRPELWRLYNTRLAKGQTARVFILSNWTETDIRSALLNNIELAPLYYSALRPVVERNGTLLVVVDESRMRIKPGDQMTTRKVRFRTLGF